MADGTASQVPHILMAPAPTVRKQNSSCDPCRRSKRRCAFPDGVNPGSPNSCMNCIHLGHNCTFDFVNSRLNQKKKAKQPVSHAQEQAIAPATSRPEKQFIVPLPADPESLDSTQVTAQNALWNGIPHTGFLDVDMFMGNLVSEWTNLESQVLTSEAQAAEQYQTSNTSASTVHSSTSHYQTPPRSPNDLFARRNSTLGLWRGSPIHLLNSSVEIQRINQSLGEVYNSMMSGIAIRYLDYNCNLFAGSYKYSFDPDQSNPSTLDINGGQSVNNALTPPWKKAIVDTNGPQVDANMAPEKLARQINKVTMIGVARFLDNFGALYSNVIDQKTRSQNERTLIAVLQAFALQFAPSRQAEGPLARFFDNPQGGSQCSTSDAMPGDRSTNSQHVFTAAWFNAHSHMVSSRRIRSFVKLYSVFLFLMTSVPPEAASIPCYEDTPLGLLDNALRQMEELQGLVQSYCGHLGRQSIYRFLLLSSVGIIRWYGYLRDTIDSVLHERPCMLEDAPPRSKGTLLSGHLTPDWQQPDLFDQEVPKHCQNAAGDLFRAYRGTINLRQILLTGDTTYDIPTLRSAITLAMAINDEFALTYGSWLQQCNISFFLLSEKSKLASAFMLLFSGLASLLLVEQLHRSSIMLPLAERQPLLDRALSYQREAVTSLLTIAQRIVDVSAMGEFRLINSVQAKMHFISHHANTVLVVLALSKAIEHTIDLYVSTGQQGDLASTTFSDMEPDSEWVASMKPLLTCLLTLDSTVSGAITARPALQKLMQQYGDILMDCWSHEDTARNKAINLTANPANEEHVEDSSIVWLHDCGSDVSSRAELVDPKHLGGRGRSPPHEGHTAGHISSRYLELLLSFFVSTLCYWNKSILLNYGRHSPSATRAKNFNMPYRSRWPLTPPTLSVPTFMFNSSSSNVNSTDKIFADAKRPDTHFLTLHTYREWSKRFAAGVQSAGLEDGDRVLLFSPNSIFYPVVVMGALMAGAIYNSANPAYTARELAHQLKDSSPRIVLAAESCIDRALEAADLVGFDRGRIFLFSEVSMDHTKEVPPVPHAKVQNWSKLLARPEIGRNFVWEERRTEAFSERTAILIYSSGTTGLPKGVELSHRSLIANILQLKTIHMSDPTVVARRTLCAVPMYHALGLLYYSFTTPKWGIETYVMERWNLADFLSHVQRFRITELVLVPPMLVALAKHPAVRDGTCDLSSVRKVAAGAAPIGMEVTQQFEELWDGRLKVRQAWGMSEAPAITLCWDERENSGPTSTSIGELVPGAEGMLVNDTGEEVTLPGETGEFWIRSPNAMKGYWRNPKATAETISNGWLKTGDIAYRDEAGKWYMVDRKKELIKVKGVAVAPAELEALLLEHNEIVDVAVIGVKTTTDDERPRAYVVRAPGSRLTENDVVDFVKARVSTIKHLTGGVAFIDAIPKNPSGKILRRQLREIAAKETGSKL
ncbi:hypothetical protein AYL99_05577 [Fonsecaea erecta]|uniref:Zn(2)-C6 fungal-type domain-containing protein n=1 Tax=Fonsecaea erecta TaxID=1367422 RepID=A0A178ZNJ1_9EURO|nr:hypothetical protein AYL99_05577 [Fonsecaea erecta]OAP60575.1 hypothetical protein AYL99_05577 [Fonsecaea erecta]